MITTPLSSFLENAGNVIELKNPHNTTTSAVERAVVTFFLIFKTDELTSFTSFKSRCFVTCLRLPLGTELN